MIGGNVGFLGYLSISYLRKLFSHAFCICGYEVSKTHFLEEDVATNPQFGYLSIHKTNRLLSILECHW